MFDNRKDKAHLIVSLIKSAFRIAAGTIMLFSNNGYVIVAGAMLVGAEVLGIVEELVV